MGIGAVPGLDELCVAVDPVMDLTVNQRSNRSRGKTLFLPKLGILDVIAHVVHQFGGLGIVVQK